ncbi:histone H1.8 isoform X2 [Lathamus discolor]|uniref:histone H1.8 isoform X2 n=1 Tax=Lathamus discolor TaxID=678569 RepID=UPI0032B775C2
MEHQPAEAAGTAQLPRLPAQHRSAPHPSTMQMVIEALRAKDSKKGASAAAIKKFILAKYPTVEPTRLKYWLKLALSKGLSRGDLLAPKMLKQKQPPGQVDPDRGEPPKPARPGASQPGRAPAAGARQAGAVRQKPAAAKEKPRARRTEAPPPAAAKPSSDEAKPPRAVGRPRGPGKGRSGPSMAPAAAEAGGDSGVSPAGARAKRPRKTPVGRSKRKAPEGAQPGAPEGAQPEGTKAKAAEGKVRKPRVKTGAGQGQAGLKKAAALPGGKKAP